MAVARANSVYTSTRQYNQALQSDSSNCVRKAEKPSIGFTKQKVDTKLSVYESTAGGTIAGINCEQLIDFEGDKSFWVQAGFWEDSYTLALNDGTAKNPRLTVADSIWLTIKNWWGGPGETRAQLRDYINHNLSEYKAHQSDTNKPFSAFIAVAYSSSYRK